MTPQELEDLTEALYDDGLTDEEVQAELANLESDPAPAAPAQPAAGGSPSVFSPSTLFPSTVKAVGDLKPAFQEFANIQDLPAGNERRDIATARFTAAPFEVAKGIGQDVSGGLFRLAGSLIPSKMTRGTVKDEATGKDRQRTFTESAQNPNASLTTGLDEGLEKTNLPEGVKTLGHVALGAAQGLGAGAIQGAGKGIIAKATAGAREATGRSAVRVADAVQNLRLGATAKDVLDGYTPRTLARRGLNRLTPQEAWHRNEQTFRELQTRAREIKGASDVTLDVNQVLADTRAELMSKKFDFNRQQVDDALEEIQQTITQQAERDGIQATARQPFVPRRPIFQLSPDEIQAGIGRGEIRFTNRGNRAVPEYSRPEVVPENFLPAEGVAPELRLNLMDLNTLKTEVGKEAAFQHLAGRVRGDKAASAAEKVFNNFYSKLKTASDPLGGPELQAINREFSELIPVQNVLARAMTREELGQALGRTDIPMTKFGLVRAAMRATRTDRMAGLNAAGESLMESGARDAAQPFSQAIGTRAAESALRMGKLGALAGSLRH